MIRSIILVAMAITIMFSSVCFASDYKLIEDKHTVVSGDTLDSIVITYMAKNTYGAREFKEFKSGIVQLNPWVLERNIEAGDIICVNYWVADRGN